MSAGPCGYVSPDGLGTPEQFWVSVFALIDWHVCQSFNIYLYIISILSIIELCRNTNPTKLVCINNSCEHYHQQ